MTGLLTQLQHMEEALHAVQQKTATVTQLCATWRAQEALYATLPGRYKTVAEDLLGRMEAGSLFGEESCSFSQEELAAHLQVWIDKARSLLNTP